jgi:predicted dehydrogenase
MSSIGIAAVGAGAWGQHVVRALAATPGARLRWVCDRNPEHLARLAGMYPGVRLTPHFDDLIADGEVDALVVAADPRNHHPLARRALQSARHVLVEKPLALSARDAADLCTLAERAQRTLMVGHLLLYDPAVALARQAIDSGELGDVLTLHSQRTNLGTVRRDENAWWSLAPHDVAIALHLIGESPTEVSATGGCFLQRGRGVEDLAFATLRFAGGRLAHVHVSWLDPLRRRTLTVVGSRKMLTFEESSSEQRIKIFDRRAGIVTGGGGGGVTASDEVAVHRGGVTVPALPPADPLRAQCDHFIDCVRTGTRPRTDGAQGLAVVRVLEAGQHSMRAGGAPTPVA